MTRMNQNNQELGRFFRTLREKHQPEEFGLGTANRRRSAGLRREEVASLAGVGLSWYTWFEQGRVRASPTVLQRLAAAFSLKADEVEYVYSLAGHHPPEAHDWTERISATLRQVLDANWVPAYVLNRRWDRIAWNAAAEGLLGKFPQDALQRNVVWRTFVCPDVRGIILDWPQLAAVTVAQFYASVSRYLEDPQLQAFVAQIGAESEEFARLWQERHVLSHAERTVAIRLGGFDRLCLNLSTYRVNDHYDQTLCIVTPVAPEDKKKLCQLLSPVR